MRVVPWVLLVACCVLFVVRCFGVVVCLLCSVHVLLLFEVCCVFVACLSAFAVCCWQLLVNRCLLFVV